MTDVLDEKKLEEHGLHHLLKHVLFLEDTDRWYQAPVPAFHFTVTCYVVLKYLCVCLKPKLPCTYVVIAITFFFTEPKKSLEI